MSSAACLAGVLALAPFQSEVPLYPQFQATLQCEQDVHAACTTDAGEVLLVSGAPPKLIWFDAQGVLRREQPIPEVLEPGGIATSPAHDSEPTYWIADSGAHRILHIDAKGQVLSRFGSHGCGSGELNAPRGLACGKDTLFVADSRNDRIAMFDFTGRWLGALGAAGGGQGQLRAPRDVALDDHGGVWVVDSANHRVQRFSSQGEAQVCVGGFGAAPGLFAYPGGIAVRAGRVFVADRDNHRVQVLDLSGAYLGEWGTHALRPREAGGKLHYPDGICLAPSGDFVAVVESFENRAQVFVREQVVDNEVRPFVLPKGGEASTHFGWGLDVDGSWLALVEPELPGVLIYDVAAVHTGAEPLLFSRWAARGLTPGRFAHPSDVALDFSAKRLAVCDPKAMRIDVFLVQAPDPARFRFDPAALKLAWSLDTSQVELPAGFAWSARLGVDALARRPGGGWLAVDRANRAVFALNASAHIESYWTGAQQRLVDPVDACVSADGALVLVADRLAGEIVAFDALDTDSPARRRWKTVARQPQGLCVAQNGEMFVADGLDHTVQRVNSDGLGIWSTSARGLGAGEFFKPRSLAYWPAGNSRADAADSGGLLFAMDWGNHRLQVLGPSGGFLLAFGDRLFTRPAGSR